MNNRSFTLIELLVVIVIIGILAGVIMISTSSSIDKANLARGQAFSSTIQEELLSSLISEWTFDEGNTTAGQIAQSSDLVDSWGNNNGMVNGNPIIRDGTNCISIKCLEFDGLGDYVDFGDILRPSQTDDRTYLFWLNLKSYGGAIFSTGNLSHYKGGYSLFRPLSSSSNYFSYELNDSPFNFSFDCSIDLNKWMFFVVSVKPDNPNINFALYKNGKLEDDQTKIMSAGSQYNTSFKIGAYTSGYPTASQVGFLNGFIDDFKVYDSILNLVQVKQNYIAGLDSLLSQKSISKVDYNQRINELAYE